MVVIGVETGELPGEEVVGTLREEGVRVSRGVVGIDEGGDEEEASCFFIVGEEGGLWQRARLR